MSKKLIFLILLMLCLLWFGMGNANHLENDSSASDLQKMKAIPIPADRGVPPFHPPTTNGERFCVIQYDEDSVAFYFTDITAGNGYAVYMDPQRCGENIYPFKITGVQFFLYHYSNGLTAEWPVEIQVNIKHLDEDTLCPDLGGPGAPFPLYHQTFKIPIDSCDSILQRPMHLSLDSLYNPSFTRCLDTTFFLEIIFTGGTDPPFPSLLFTDTTDPPDICHDWHLFEGDYYEWCYYAWELPIPGKVVLRATGYTNSMDCHSCWYWKEPDTTTAPSGMPDFDQYQFGDSSALDVPTAVANCLWWFDAVPQDTLPPDLIRLLSTYFDTDPDSGTFADSAQNGLNRYFTEYEFDLDALIYPQPDFSEIVDSLRNYQNIVLILGFWQSDGDSWYRFGGHAVTLAGVCSESFWVGLSDPAVDGAELGWQGRFFPIWHPPHPENDTLHNNSIYVSQDIYVSDTSFVIHDDTLWTIKEFSHADTLLFRRFEGRNFQPGQEEDGGAYDPAQPVYTEVEYAIVICPVTAVEEVEEVITFEDFQLFQNHPNPFNNETTIKYALSKSGHVSLVIYNILGQKVKTLVTEYQKAGVKTVSWDGKDEKGKDLSSGIYFYQLKAGAISQTKRMVLLK